MANNVYCEPCRRFLRGEVSFIEKCNETITFKHHNDYESLDLAINLPCSICSLAWQYAEQFPSALDCAEGVKGHHSYNHVERRHALKFFAPSTWSAQLCFVPSCSIHETSDPERLSSSTGSDSALGFLLEKFEHCFLGHTKCNPTRRPSQYNYPSRLLDVGTTQQSLIILRSTSLFRNEEYVCLSHCWGSVKPFTLNAQTHSALSTGLDMRALPKTFQEAILVTRRLRIQYIWIDSLYAIQTPRRNAFAQLRRCILQDDVQDWASESRRMGDVYANAKCTIAATAAKNSSEGLFVDRCPQSLHPRLVEFHFNKDAPWLEGKMREFALSGQYMCDVQLLAQNCIELAPLNKRAWVSQERQLSRRILHFTSTQLFWECHENLACETHPVSLPTWAQAWWTHDGTALKNRVRDIIHQRPHNWHTLQALDPFTYYAWLKYMRQYTRCALTRATDKLVAIHGIARWVSQAAGDRFVAGLWEGHIIEELCWVKYRSLDDPMEPTEWRAPTWSWACTDTAIGESILTRWHSDHASRHAEAALVYLDISAKTSGELEYASMKLRCKPLRTICTAMSDDYFHPRIEIFDQDEQELEVFNTLGGREIRFYADHPHTVEPLHGYMIIMHHCRHGSESEVEDNAEALFIRIQDEGREHFERIGIFRFQGSHAVDQILRLHCQAEDRVITLV